MNATATTMSLDERTMVRIDRGRNHAGRLEELRVIIEEVEGSWFVAPRVWVKLGNAWAMTDKLPCIREFECERVAAAIQRGLPFVKHLNATRRHQARLAPKPLSTPPARSSIPKAIPRPRTIDEEIRATIPPWDHSPI